MLEAPSADAAALVTAYRKRSSRKGDRRTGRECVELALQMEAMMTTHSITSLDLSRLTSITAGAIHHYRSLLRLAPSVREDFESDRFGFKVARALADIEDPVRQVEIAALFVSQGGKPPRFSSVYVERMARIVKERPAISLDDLVAALLGREGDWSPDDEAQPPPPVRRDPLSYVEAVGSAIVLCQTLQSERVPEVARLQLTRLLPVLSRQAGQAAEAIQRPVRREGTMPI